MELKEQLQCLSSQDINNTEHFQMTDSLHQTLEQDQLSAVKDRDEIQTFKMCHNLRIHVENLHLFCKTSNELINKMDLIFTQYKQAVKFRFEILYQPPQNQPTSGNDGPEVGNQYQSDLMDKVEDQCFKELENGVLFVKNFEILKLMLQARRENCIVKPQIDFHSYFSKQILDNYDPIVNLNCLYKQITSDQDSLQIQDSKTPSNQQYFNDEIFLKVNSVHIIHAFKRILKAVKTQIDDYQAGTFYFSTVKLSQDGLGGQNIEEIIQIIIQELELKCEYWLNMWNNKFKTKKQPQSNLIETPQIWNGFSNQLLKDLQFQLKNFLNGQNIRQENSSIIDIFPEFYVDNKIHENNTSSTVFQNQKRQNNSNILLLCLLQSGNTIDGISISSKILQRHISLILKQQSITNFIDQENKALTDPQQDQAYDSKQAYKEINYYQLRFNNDKIKEIQNQQQVLNKFFDWKKRRCHGCLEYMVETSRAVVCFNVIKVDNPCRKLYCFNCTINYCQTKSISKDNKESGHHQSQNSENMEKQKKLQCKILRKNQRQKAFQNVLFTCPCCQDECHESSKENFEMSFCKLKNIIERKPTLMLHKHILIQLNPKILNITGVFSRLIQTKQFLLAQVVGYDSPKKLFRINLCYNENNPISKPDKLVDTSMREECSFQTSLSPLNTNYMFLSTILQHNDSFKLNTGKNNDFIDQFNNKKIMNSRLYKMLNAAINKNEKSDNMSFISNGQIDQDRKFVIIDIKNEIIESIMNLKKQEGKEFVVLERYSEHLSQKGGLEFLQQLSQYYEQTGYIERRLFVQNLRQNKTYFKSASNNLQINELKLQQQELNLSEEIQEINSNQSQEHIQQKEKTQKNEIFQQNLEEIQDNCNIIQQDNHQFQIENKTQSSQNILENPNEQVNIEISSSNKKQKNENFQNGILEVVEQTFDKNLIEQIDKSQIVNKDNIEADLQQKRYIVPVVNQKKLENIQKQLEKEFSKIEKLKEKQAIQENQMQANPSQNKTLNINQRERQVILKSEQKIDKLLKQESYLQQCQNNFQNKPNSNTLIVNNDQILSLNQDLFQPKEVLIQSKKLNQNEDPENLLLDQNNLVYNSRLKDGKLFIKKYKYNNRLRKHIQFLKEYAAVKPEDFLGLIIYKLNKEQNLWYRSKIVSNKIIQGENQKIEFDIKHMNYESDMDRLDSLKDEFILDQALDPLLKDENNLKSIAFQKRNKKNQTSKSEFNDQQRIHKILMKEWQKNQNKMSLAQAISYEDPQTVQQNIRKQDEFHLQNHDKTDKKRKKALIVIQTRFPFEQSKQIFLIKNNQISGQNPQILHAGQKKWLGKMKQTPRKNKAIKLSNQNTPLFKNGGDEQIYYSDINSEEAYDQQSLNIDNVLSIYQLKIHYCKEIVQHFQFQQNNLSMKLYQQRQSQNKGDVEFQSFVNPMDAFLANQKQINYPNISNPITVVSQPHSVYGDSSSAVFNEKNTVLTVSAQDNSLKNEKQRKNFSKGAIEERIRQSMGKRKHFQLLLKLFQQKKMNGLNFDDSVLQLSQINQKINQQQQLDYQQLHTLPYQNILYEQQRIQQLKMLCEQQNENGQKQIFNQYGVQNFKMNPFINKQMVIQIPQYEDQQQIKRIVLKANNQDLYNEQTMNDSTIKEMRSEMNQKGIKLVNQQESVMNQQNNYYTEQNQLLNDINSQFQANQYNVQQLICKQNLQQNGYNQFQQQYGMNEQIQFQSQNDALNPSFQQASSSQQQENVSQSKQEIEFTKSQTQIEKSFINNHLQTLDNIAKSNNIYQKQLGDQIQQQATLPSTWHYEFYEKKGFRKCGCETCKNVPYPALIASHANENESKLVEDHRKYFQNADVRHQMLLLQQQDLRAQCMANQGYSCSNSSNIRFTQEINRISHIKSLQPSQSQEQNVSPQADLQNQQQQSDNQNWMWENNQQIQINNTDLIDKEEILEQVDPHTEQEQENPIQQYQEQNEEIEQVNEANSEERRNEIQKIEEEMNIQKEQFNLGRQIYEKGFASLKEREEQLNQHFQIYNGIVQNESNEQLDEQARQLQSQMKMEMEQQITSSQQEIYIHQLQLNYQYLKLFEVDQAMTILQNKIDTLNQQNIQETFAEEQQIQQNEFSNQNIESPNQLEQNQELVEEEKNNFECDEIVQDVEGQVNIYEPQEINEAEDQLQ